MSIDAASRPLRVAVANWSFRRVGGTETYLSAILPQMLKHGMEVGIVREMERPMDRARIELPGEVPEWNLEVLGLDGVLQGVRDWGPDVIYTHILEDPDLEEGLLDIAPSVFDAHAYYGTCISGFKAHAWPVARPCHKQFGLPCLIHYLPRGCGGRNPVTMVRRFQREVRRAKLLPRYGALVVHSSYMREEYAQHGVERERIFNLSLGLFADAPADPLELGQVPVQLVPAQAATGKAPVRLVFSGRMDRPKGGSLLLESLPLIQRALDRPVLLTLAGDGPVRERWEREAAHLMRHHTDIEVVFAGWLSSKDVTDLFSSGDLLTIPSVWPEPFGRIGVEAGRVSLPSVAFAVGGIPDWLIDGVNGHLASGEPPTAVGFAEAVVKALRDPVHHAMLRNGARARSAGVIETGPPP